MNVLFGLVDPSNEPVFQPNTEFFNSKPGIRNDSFSDVWNRPDLEVIKFLTDNNFTNIRKLEDGSWVGCMALMTTMSVCVDITPVTCYAYRWCFKNPEDAFHFCNNIKEFDEVPSKRDSLVGHRYSLESRMASTNELGHRRW